MKELLGKGVCDPHIRIFNNKAYLYASHDLSKDSENFVMPDWWIWSSNNLVNWQYEATLKPEDVYMGEPSMDCWATDAISRNGKYYWYFSDHRKTLGLSQIGVVVSDNPTGPWSDPLGKPMIPHRSDAEVYDPAIFQEEDETTYILYGAFDYYIARLNEDMISLAETPRKIEVINPQGPYGEKTDDKVFLHKRKNKYYLSWGCFYAMSDNIYGPYYCKGTIISEDLVEENFKAATWPNGLCQGRHGNFFEWHNQWYFTYCDMSYSGNRYFRDSWISYIHYKKNGEIAPIKIDGCGVGQYDASKGKIVAANYFKAEGIKIVESEQGAFDVLIERNTASLTYPNIFNCSTLNQISLCISTKNTEPFNIKVLNGTVDAQLLGTIDVQPVNQSDDYFIVTAKLEGDESLSDICLSFSDNAAIGVKVAWLALS